MKQVRISAVIPAFNAEAVLGRAIESVLRQTCKVDEIVVINDGSTDTTVDVMQSFGKRIVSYSTANGGAAAARNVGISKASGNWIAFLDADDEWMPDKVERQMEVLVNHPHAVLTYGQMQDIGEDAGQRYVWPDRVCDTEEDVCCRMYWACLAELPPTSTVVARRDELCAVGLFPTHLRTAEDLDLWVRLRSRGPFIGVPSVVANRYLTRGSLTASNSKALQFQRYLSVLSDRREEILSWLRGQQVDGAAYVHTNLANVYMREGKRFNQIYHAAVGVRSWHPQRVLAAKLLLEGVVGAKVYKTLVSIFRYCGLVPIRNAVLQGGSRNLEKHEEQRT